MSSGGVHDSEMPTLPDDQWPADDPALAAFAEDLRLVAGGPAPEPRPGLVAVMQQGAVVPSGAHTGSRKKMLIKTLVGSLVAKVAMASGVAAATVTAAGAAGVLPDPAQHAIATVVAAATPFSVPDPGGSTLQVTGPSTSGATTSTTLAGDDDGDDEGTGTGGAAGERKVNHGACVSAAARDKAESEAQGQNHGKTVSSIARTDCGKESTTTSSTTSTTIAGSTTTTSTTSTTVAGASNANSGRGNSGNSGSGGGNSGNSGSGGGNSSNSGGGSGNSGTGSSGRN